MHHQYFPQCAREHVFSNILRSEKAMSRLFGGACLGETDMAGVAIPFEGEETMNVPTETPRGFLRLSSSHFAFVGAATTKKKSADVVFATKHIIGCSVVGSLITVYACAEKHKKKGKQPPSDTPFSQLMPKQRPAYVLSTLAVTADTAENASKIGDEVKGIIVEQSGFRDEREILVFVNPFSGKKKAEKLLLSCEPAIRAIPNVSVRVVRTERRLHAREVVNSLPTLPHAIVVVSGDGVMNEVITGLLSRSDARSAKNVRILHLPGGTSNGLAESLGTNHIASALLSLCRGVSIPWDVVAYRIGESPEIGYSCTALSWALIPDADIGTEWMRGIGQTRITLGVVGAIVKGKFYQGTLHYCEDSPALDAAISEDMSGTSQLGATALEAVPLGGTGEGWQSAPHNDFLIWTAGQVNVIDPTFPISLDAKGWSGRVLMAYNADKISRLQTKRILDDVDAGQFLRNKHIESHHVKAYTLQIGANTRFLSSDGESIPVGNVRAVVMPGAVSMVASADLRSQVEAEIAHASS